MCTIPRVEVEEKKKTSCLIKEAWGGLQSSITEVLLSLMEHTPWDVCRGIEWIYHCCIQTVSGTNYWDKSIHLSPQKTQSLQTECTCQSSTCSSLCLWGVSILGSAISTTVSKDLLGPEFKTCRQEQRQQNQSGEIWLGQILFNNFLISLQAWSGLEWCVQAGQEEHFPKLFPINLSAGLIVEMLYHKH